MKLKGLSVITLFALVPVLVSLACSALSGGNAPTQTGPLDLKDTKTPTPLKVEETGTPHPTSQQSLSIAEQLAQVDQVLSQSLTASIVYTVPPSMKLDESETIELLLNPVISPEALATQVTEGGQVITSTIQITPRMKAVLISQDPDAFEIQSGHDNAEQLISGTETTKWAWFITAKKAGSHRLILYIYRLVKTNEQESWREVLSRKAVIDVEVTVAQRIEAFDWKWLIGIVIPLLGIPSLWGYIVDRKKKRKKPSK